MDAFLAFELLQCSKTIEILVKGTQMQQPTKENPILLLLMTKKKETMNTITELRMQRCNTDIDESMFG